MLWPVCSVQLRPSSISAHDTSASARLGGLRTASAGVYGKMPAIRGYYGL